MSIDLISELSPRQRRVAELLAWAASWLLLLAFVPYFLYGGIGFVEALAHIQWPRIEATIFRNEIKWVRTATVTTKRSTPVYIKYYDVVAQVMPADGGKVGYVLLAQGVDDSIANQTAATHPPESHIEIKRGPNGTLWFSQEETAEPISFYGGGLLIVASLLRVVWLSRDTQAALLASSKPTTGMPVGWTMANAPSDGSARVPLAGGGAGGNGVTEPIAITSFTTGMVLVLGSFVLAIISLMTAILTRMSSYLGFRVCGLLLALAVARWFIRKMAQDD